MKKFIKSILTSACLMSVSLAFAASPITVINNSKGQIDFGFTHCNNDNLCNLISSGHLDSVKSNTNSISIMAPAGMDNFSINTAEMFDENHTKIASLKEVCKAPRTANVVILNDHGSGQIHCIYKRG